MTKAHGSRPTSHQRPPDRGKARAPRPARGAAPSTSAPPGRGRSSPARYLPAAVGLVLAMVALLGVGSEAAAYRASLAVAAVGLLAWNAQLLTAPAHAARPLAITVELKPQHYVQACAHSLIYAYWAWHVPLVREALPLIAVQLAFAYGFDLLLSWTRHGRYTLGFGPFPVVFSTNLFLWFKPDWFFFQLAMIVVGFAAKALVHWERDGRRTHVFNPSSFPLAIASLGLLLSGTTHLTYGEEIAFTQAIPPHMHLLLYAVALPGQLLFGVASMTVAAVLSTYLFGLVYLRATGTYFFFDLFIPVPVFLGMHLLFTDPSTAPRTELGRLAFGVIYGLSTCLLYELFMRLDVPPFYDKLLQVPLMNLSVRALDRAARSRWGQALAPERLGRSLAPRARHVAYAGVWMLVFVGLQASDGLGDRHPGQWLPFWREACDAGRPRACAYLAVVEQGMCGAGSGWACNEAAILGPRDAPGLHAPMDPARRRTAFEVGCRLGYAPACRNLGRLANPAAPLERGEPTLRDLPIILRGSRLGPVTDTEPGALHRRACAQGWRSLCPHHADTSAHAPAAP